METDSDGVAGGGESGTAQAGPNARTGSRWRHARNEAAAQYVETRSTTARNLAIDAHNHAATHGQEHGTD